MKIYTKGGDKGRTSIFGGERVDKDDIRIETNGLVDELNTVIGIVRAHMSPDNEMQPILFRIQKELMAVMSNIATPSYKSDVNPNLLSDKIVENCEEVIDDLTKKMGDNKFFILPGGTIVSSFLHLARTTARKCERRLCTLNKTDAIPSVILKYFNRLSDLFFVMSRYDLYNNKITEERWQSFDYKKKSAKTDLQ